MSLLKGKVWKLYTLLLEISRNTGRLEGGLSTKKYASMTNSSIPTAKRDITKLVGYGLIEQVEGSAGRNTRYVIKLGFR